MRCLVNLDGAEREFSVAPAENGELRVSLDGRSFVASVVNVAPDEYSVLIDGRSFNFVVSRSGGEFLLCSQHGLSRVAFPNDRRTARAGAQAAGKAEVRAMMPGRVVEVSVKPGQRVERGQGLVVIEAMKMENEVKAPKAGTIAQVLVAAGQTVEKGDILAVVE